MSENREKIVHMNEMQLACLEHVGPYEEIGATFSKFGGICAQARLFRPNTQMIALYFDDPDVVPAAELRSAACITIDADTEIPASLERTTVAAGEHAMTVHTGPYSELGTAYGRLGEWIKLSGRTPRNAPCYEIYKNDPAVTAPEELVTEIYFPLV